MRRTKEDAAKTQQDILNSALSVFSKVGYDAARLNDIAAEAGVTRGAIYHHFENKTGLFMALVADAASTGNRAIQSAVEEGGTFIEIITRILIYSMELLEEDRRFREITTLTLFKMGGSEELESYREQQRQAANELVQNIAGFFQMGIEQGVLRPGVEPITAARAFLAYQSGLSLLWLSNPGAFSIKENAAQLADVFIKGVEA